MDLSKSKNRRPIALVILDGWGYAPRTEGNAIAIAHTPYYDEICRKYPMTTLSASGAGIGEVDASPGNAEVGHLNIGTGRVAQTEVARIKIAVASGEFLENTVLNRAFGKAKSAGSALHLIGLMSDGGVHSSTENLFALLRLAKKSGLTEVYIHCILDGLDVQERTADIYVEALEIKLADIGIGKIATMCGRFFAMDSTEHWERTARVFTMLVHAEGERSMDAVTSVRNSFLRGISDEFIAPIVIEKAPDIPVATVKSGDLVVFFNHRAEGMRQLVRSLCIPEGASGAKPMVETVCLTEYDRAFNLPAAFRQEPEKNTLTEVLSGLEIPNVKITEAARFPHLTYFFDGGADSQQPFEEQVLVRASESARGEAVPESQSFKIADMFRKGLESTPNGVFVVNIPAADLMAETGDLRRTVAAIQYVDTCLGGIYERVRECNGVMMITSTHGNCEEMIHIESGEPNPLATANPVPFHYIDDTAAGIRLYDGRSLEDIAPTILSVLDIDKPAEMTGSDLRCI
ncbi:2,3-bisphosphoglycerate-independent phosphoglycerate mutase [soil metagenome]